MKIVMTDNCLCCENTLDSTFHALIDCPYTAESWRQIEFWLQTTLDMNINISEKETTFGPWDKLVTRCIYN